MDETPNVSPSLPNYVLREKLTVMGPGEALVDTDLEAVVKQLGDESSEETGV